MEVTSSAVVDSTPAVEAIEIPRSNTPEYTEWRKTGNTPKAGTVPAQDKGDPGVTPAPTDKQEVAKKGKTADERIAELESTIAKIKSGKEAKQAESQTAPAKKAEPQPTRPKPKSDGKGPDGKPYETYEDFTEDLADWKAEQRIEAMEQSRRQREQQNALNAEVEKARTRYDNLDEVMFPALKEIMSANIAPVVQEMLNDSAVLPDLLYTIGSDAEELAAFIKMSPGKQIRYLAITENLIREELDKPEAKSAPLQGADGKFVKSEPTPAKRGPESAPEPPIEIGSRGAGVVDDEAKAFSDAERGDPRAFRRWMNAANAKEIRRRNGV